LTTVAAGFTYGGPAMSHALDNILMVCCVSAFFAGLVVAIATLPA